jgi:hypothetical protein
MDCSGISGGVPRKELKKGKLLGCMGRYGDQSLNGLLRDMDCSETSNSLI